MKLEEFFAMEAGLTRRASVVFDRDCTGERIKDIARRLRVSQSRASQLYIRGKQDQRRGLI